MPTGARVELFLGGAWVDVTADVVTRNPITITRGRPDEGTRTDPGTCKLTLRNADGKYSPRNPRSPYFGQLGRNTSLRVSALGNATVLAVPGSGTSLSTPDAPGLDIIGDLDVRVDAALDNWYTEGVIAAVDLAGKFNLAAGARSWFLQSRDGRPYLEWSTDGATTLAAVGTTSPQATTGLGRRMAWRATLDVDNGAGGWTVTYYTAPTLAGPWTVLEQVSGAGVTSIFAGTAQLRAASATNVVFGRPIGEFHGFELRNGINGPVVASTDIGALAPGTTSWVDAAGNTWTVGAAAAVTDRRTRFVGEVSNWPGRWGLTGDDAEASIVASGILRRLGQGAAPLDSTLRRRLPTLGPQAYWPMEDGQRATQAASPIEGVPPLGVEGMEFAANSTLASSAPLPVIRSNGQRAGFFGWVPQPAGTPTDWQVFFVYRIDQINPDLEEIIRIVTSGTATEWVLEQSDNEFDIVAYNSAQVEIHRQGVATGTDLYDQWIVCRFRVSQVGGNVFWEIIWQDVGGDAGSFSNTFAGTIGFPTALAGPLGAYTAAMDGMSIGHLSVWEGNSSTLYAGAVDAWAGELAGARMLRLAEEEGVPLTVTGVVGDTEPVGVQDQSTLLELLRDCADADGGALYERRDKLGLMYRPRAAMYTQAPVLALTYGSGHEVSPPLEPVDDDQYLRNDVTVTRAGGSSGRAVRSDGPLSVQAPPDGVGLYAEEVTVNLGSDERAEPQANWRVHLGTWDEARYPVVPVRLHNATHLIDAACAVDTGSRLTIANPPPWLPPGEIDLLVQGYAEVLGVHTWEIDYHCTPGRPWQVAAVADPVYGRVDTDGSELAASVSDSATTLSVATPVGAVWVTAGAVLNPNPDFETDLSGWIGIGATITRVAITSPAGGMWAMAVTPDGVAAFPHAASSEVPAVAGTGYTVSGWVRCPLARNLDLSINWFDAAHAYLSTSTASVAVAGETWTWIEGTFTAPASTAFASLVPTVPSTPPVGHVMLCHRVTLRPALPGATPMDFPFDVRIGGERMTVVAASGTSSPQSFTVVRGVDGFSAGHAAAADVRLADPSYVAL